MRRKSMSNRLRPWLLFCSYNIILTVAGVLKKSWNKNRDQSYKLIQCCGFLKLIQKQLSRLWGRIKRVLILGTNRENNSFWTLFSAQCEVHFLFSLLQFCTPCYYTIYVTFCSCLVIVNAEGTSSTRLLWRHFVGCGKCNHKMLFIPISLHCDILGFPNRNYQEDIIRRLFNQIFCENNVNVFTSHR